MTPSSRTIEDILDTKNMEPLEFYVHPHKRVYPVSHNAKHLCEVMDKEYLTPRHITALKELGIPVTFTATSSRLERKSSANC